MEATLKATVIGGLLATIPLLLGLLVQIYIHVSENKQKKKEAKIQLALELLMNDIKIMENSVDNVLRALDVVGRIQQKRIFAKLSEEEVRAEYASAFSDANSIYSHLGESAIISDKLASSLGHEVLSEYHSLNHLVREYVKLLVSPSASKESGEVLYTTIVTNAGKLHNMLKEKLISIRDT